MTASTSIVTLSRVITGCGSIFVICSRRSIVSRTEAKKGTIGLRPALGGRWNGAGAGWGEPREAAEALDDLHLLLRHDSDRPHQHDQQKQRDAEQHRSRHIR